MMVRNNLVDSKCSINATTAGLILFLPLWITIWFSEHQTRLSKGLRTDPLSQAIKHTAKTSTLAAPLSMWEPSHALPSFLKAMKQAALSHRGASSSLNNSKSPSEHWSRWWLLHQTGLVFQVATTWTPVLATFSHHTSLSLHRKPWEEAMSLQVIGEKIGVVQNPVVKSQSHLGTRQGCNPFLLQSQGPTCHSQSASKIIGQMRAMLTRFGPPETTSRGSE